MEPPSYKGIQCAVNPLIGREREYPKFPRATRERKIMIIGGGHAGMEACQRAIEAGHEVVLYDKNAELGGMLHTAAALPFKGDMRRYTEWMIKKCYESDATIHLNTEVTPDIISQENPDVVLVAVGGVPVVPNVPIAEGRKMIWAGDVDTGKEKVGDKIVVVGAGLTGIETAIQLASEGKDVTVIDMIPPQAFLKGTAGMVMMSIMCNIQEKQIPFIYEARMEEITAEGVVYVDAAGNRVILLCDTIINAIGTRIENAVLDAVTVVADL